MLWEPEFRKSLLNYFEVLKKRNHRLSVRAFAKKLEVSPGTMSEIMRGSKRWKLTSERALKILEKMEISPREKNYLRVLMGALPEGPVPPSRTDVDIVKDWAYGPVLMSFDVAATSWSAEDQARRFGLSPEKIRSLVDDLVRKGFLEASPDGRLRRVEGGWDLGQGLPEDLERSYQQDGLMLAQKALGAIPSEERHFVGLTFAANKRNFEIYRQEIRQFVERLMALTEGDEKDEVFRLNVGLFPLDFSEKNS